MPPKIPTIPQASDWRRVMETGMQFTELRRSQARTIVSDLVAQGHVAREHMSEAVEDVIELSRRRSDNLRKVVQKEVQRQLGSLGFATKSDLNKLERRLMKATRDAKKKTGPSKKSSSEKKSAPKSASKAG